jgi:UDP-N-acetylmuramoyl-tripeptide--D-alanyl-D-alanine ligase
MTVGEAAEACKGIIDDTDEAIVFNGVSTDTREDQNGLLFVPLKGSNFDGHDYIEQALKLGAIAALSERGAAPNIIRVKSTLRALADLAARYRERFSLPVVAITGSAGKTTTKDMIASVLSQRYKTLKTEANLNNEIGLPKTIFKLDETYEVAVLELGMNHAGEISRLSRVAKPDICVITNIGAAHIENLGSRESILKAKAEIFDYMDSNGLRVLNGDDNLLRTLDAGGRRVLYFSGKNLDYANVNDLNKRVYADNVTRSGAIAQSCDIIYDSDRIINVTVPLPGEHMILNALAAAAVGFELGLSVYEIKKGIETFTPSKNRMEITRQNNSVIINDVYNANPQSMKAALNVLKNIGETERLRKIAILGDMFELGEQAPAFHEEIGEYAANIGIDELICIGELSAHIYNGFVDIGTTASHFNAKSDFEIYLEEPNKKSSFTHAAILVKASRGMAFETIVNRLKDDKHEQ